MVAGRSARSLRCPECVLSMQPFFVAVKPEGSRVELDRCPKCARVWFDPGELERAVGKKFLPRLKGGRSALPCPVCQGPMQSTLVGGEVAVEECGACAGALLDAHQFEELSGQPLKEVKPPPPPAAKPPPLPARTQQLAATTRTAAVTRPSAPAPTPAQSGRRRRGKVRASSLPPTSGERVSVVEYDCARCYSPVKVGEGGQVRGAWVCRTCELKPWPDQPGLHEQQAQWSGGQGASLLDMLGDVLNVLFGAPR